MPRFNERLLTLSLPIGAAILLVASSRPPDIPFQVRMIDPGANETVAVADLNNDGRADIVSGENWYAAPAWTKHPLREIGFTSNYVDNFTDITPLDAVHHFDIRGGVPDLKTNDDAQFTFRLLPCKLNTFTSCNIDGRGFFAVNMFPCLDCCLQKPGVGIGWG